MCLANDMKNVQVDVSNLRELPEGEWKIVLNTMTQDDDVFWNDSDGWWQEANLYVHKVRPIVARPLELGDTK